MKLYLNQNTLSSRHILLLLIKLGNLAKNHLLCIYNNKWRSKQVLGMVSLDITTEQYNQSLLIGKVVQSASSAKQNVN